MISNINEAEQFLSKFIFKTAHVTGKNITLGRTLELLEKVGNPHAKLKVLHVAGTSGKTSTSYYISSLIKESGSTVGLTVSPHITSITERLQINNKPVEENEFCSLLNEFIGIIGEDPDASYFEFLITFVLWVFYKKKVDYVVLETGLGGLHDSTNVCSQENKVCVITDIGFDHQHILGDTIQKIASQKAGIIHKHNTVFMNAQTEEIEQVFIRKSNTENADINIFESYENTIDDLPIFQKRNWSLAKKVFDYIALRDGLQIPDNAKLINSQKTIVPARMQIITKNDQIFVFDGAHNQQKMSAFIGSIIKNYPGEKANFILAIKEDKDYKKVIEEIKAIADRVICIGFESMQDFPIKSVDPDLVIEACKLSDVNNVEKAESLEVAIEKLITCGSRLNIITGSFYILGKAMSIIKSKNVYH